MIGDFDKPKCWICKFKPPMLKLLPVFIPVLFLDSDDEFLAKTFLSIVSTILPLETTEIPEDVPKDEEDILFTFSAIKPLFPSFPVPYPSIPAVKHLIKKYQKIKLKICYLITLATILLVLSVIGLLCYSKSRTWICKCANWCFVGQVDSEFFWDSVCSISVFDEPLILFVDAPKVCWFTVLFSLEDNPTLVKPTPSPDTTSASTL